MNWSGSLAWLAEAKRVGGRISVDGTAAAHFRQPDRTQALGQLLSCLAVLEIDVHVYLLRVFGVGPPWSRDDRVLEAEHRQAVVVPSNHHSLGCVLDASRHFKQLGPECRQAPRG